MPSKYENPRIDHENQMGNPSIGRVKADFKKIGWLAPMLVLGTVGSLFHASVGAIAVFVGFTLANICLGHSLGMHRLLIHRSFRCPKWLEYFLVHLGTISGIAGPLTMMRTHDVRDWAQRQAECHAFFTQVAPWHVDLYRQLFCRIELEHPPSFTVETEVGDDPIYRWMERTWMWQQVPWALVLYGLGGVEWVLWGICSRVSAIVVGHWFIGYLAHNHGHRDWDVSGAAVQGHNVPWSSIVTMGECWHNNHHAFPGSARMGLYPGQWDLGWSALRLLEKTGLVADLKCPDQLSQRGDLVRISSNSRVEPLF